MECQSIAGRDTNKDIYVMVNWHPSKQGIHGPVSHDLIVGSGLELIKVACYFLKFIADQVLVFK